ncbi:hypothetical protein COS86_05935 [Candidatus Bathyarchaeota archaeon CG07_land_8_20_14_0_80_47_9]|nr:MAG: hypothetical protein COS86_05935 [Candidatus Bathyarchaeota archaeon CG07_land_8_20_14_0_80_47_9]
MSKNVITDMKRYLVEKGQSLGLFGYDVIGFIGLIVLGLIIIFIIRLVLILIPAIIVAVVVWFFTRSMWWAGIAFLVIAALSVLKKLW